MDRALFDFDDNEQEQFFNNQRKDMKKLLSAATTGTQIRIWKSNTPYSTCGFYFICDVLRNIDCQISVVTLPEYQQVSDNEIVIYSDWGQVNPGKLYQFLPFIDSNFSLEDIGKAHLHMEGNHNIGKIIINVCE